MRIFHNRPFALAFCMLAVCSVAAFFFSFFFKLLLLIVSLFVLLLIATLYIFLRKRERIGRVLLLIFLCLLSASVALSSSLIFFQGHYDRAQSWNGREITVKGEVLGRITSEPYLNVFDAYVTEWNGQRTGMRVIFETSYASALQSGDGFEAVVTPRAFEVSASFDEERYRLADGYVSALVCKTLEDCRIFTGEGKHPLSIFTALNISLSSKLYHAVEGEEGALAVALLLGNRSFLSSATEMRFARTGISHLLALSGLHVSILMGILEFLLRRMRMPKLVRMILLPLAAGVYLALTGFSPSTCRAVLMACMLYFGFLLRSQYDSFTALCTALGMILTVSPYSVLDCSMWFSFLAAGAIVIFSPLIARLGANSSLRTWMPSRVFALLQGLIGAILVGSAANLALMLMISFIYGEVSLLSVPATLLLSIPTSASLFLSLLTLLLPFLAPLCKIPLGWMLSVAREGAALDRALLPVGDLSTKLCLALLTVSLIIFAVCKIKRYVLYLIPVLLFVFSIGASLAVTHLESDGVAMTYAKAGSGSVCLFSERGKAVAIDFSDSRGGAARVIADIAKEERCTELDDLVLTRYVNMQAHYLESISKNIRIKRLHLPPPSNESEEATAMRLFEVAQRLDIEFAFGCDELSIPSARILRYEHESVDTSAVPAVLVCAEIGSVRVTCMNMAVMSSSLLSVAENEVHNSEYLIVSDAGFTADTRKCFPYASDTLSVLLLEDERLSDLLPNGAHPFSVHSGVEKVRFILKKSHFSVTEKGFFSYAIKANKSFEFA